MKVFVAFSSDKIQRGLTKVSAPPGMPYGFVRFVFSFQTITSPPPSQNTHLNPRAIIIQHFPHLHTITVQCEIPPTQINAKCKQCLYTHGPVCEGLRCLSMFTGYCTCRAHNIHTIINPRTQLL